MHKKEFPLPDVCDSSYIVQDALVNEEDELLGAYFVRVTSEIVFIFDENLSSYRKAKLWKEAVENVLMKNLPSMGIRSTHLFILPESDTKYAELLIKKFGFVRATGIPLYFEV